MNRRSFLQTAGKAGLATGLTSIAAQAYIPKQNWEKYDWGVPKLSGIRQAMLMLPQETDWKGLKLKNRTRGQGCPVSREMGLPPRDQSGWTSDARAQSALVRAL